MPRNSARNGGNRSGRNNNPSGRNQYSDWGVTEMVRDRPIAAAAAAAGAAAAGLFLWSRRSQISNQLSNISDQIGEWTENMGSSEGQFETGDDTAGLTTSRQTATTNRRGMSATGGGNASLGRRSGGGGVRSTASGRGRVQSAPTT
jgi:hypothetical protein